MNAKELTEKIINDLDIQDTRANQSRWLESLLEAALDDAVKEVWQAGWRACVEKTNEIEQESPSAGYEDGYEKDNRRYCSCAEWYPYE